MAGSLGSALLSLLLPQGSGKLLRSWNRDLELLVQDLSGFVST